MRVVVPIGAETIEGDAMQEFRGTLTIRVDAPLVLVTDTLPGAVVGRVYSHQLVATGGVVPHLYEVVGLPPGLTCSPSGEIAGTPTEATAGDVTLEVIVRSA